MDNFFFFFIFFFFWEWDKPFLLDMEKFLLDMEFFVMTWNFLLDMKKLFLDMEVLRWVFWDMVFCGHLDDWLTLFCRTSKVEVPYRCRKAYRRYCPQTLRTSLTKPASRCFSKFYWIMIPMSIRISSYSLLCQGDIPFSRHWWGDVDTSWLFSHYWLETGWWNSWSQWFRHFSIDKSLLGMMPSKMKS